MAQEPPSLNMLGEKILPQHVQPELLTYCPTMDLIALVTADEQTQVFRLNGQRVFSVQKKSPSLKISQLSWKPNGSLLAIAYDDLSVSLINSQTGKAVTEIHCSSRSTSPICTLSWNTTFTNLHAFQAMLLKKDGQHKIEEFLTKPEILGGLLPPNLPDEFGFLDVEHILPRLSTLPLGGQEDDVFSLRTSLDVVFHSSSQSAQHSIDSLCVGFEEGSYYVSIHDCFEIGSFASAQVSKQTSSSKVVAHASHPLSSTHALLSKSTNGELEALHLVPLDLLLIPETGKYLSLLAAKATQLQNLLRYLKEVQTHVFREFKTSQELPGRFMRNVSESLTEKTTFTWPQAAYHLVVTGDCPPPVKEWLVDELGDRGHKRWEKAAITGYEGIRRLVHESLIPTLERFTTVVTRFRGLARFYESANPLGLETEDLNDIVDTLSCLQVLAHTILKTTCRELRQFTAFSVWLKSEIEIQTIDPTDAAADELAVKDPMLDYSEVLAYVEGPMLASRLVELFDIQSEEDKRPRWDIAAEQRSIFDFFKTQMRMYNTGGIPEQRIPGLSALLSRLDQQCRKVFSRIAEAQKRKVCFRDPITIVKQGQVDRSAPTGLDKFDMRVILHPQKGSHMVHCYIAFEGAVHTVHIHQIALLVENGYSRLHKHKSAVIELPHTIEDFKFADDENIMIACRSTTSSMLISIPYNESSTPSPVPYGTHNETRYDPSMTLSLGRDGDEIALRTYIRHVFPSVAPAFAIERIEVNGRKGRRVVCVVAKDRLRLRFFDLDSHEEDVDGQEVNDQEEGDGSEGEGMQIDE
ncbi:hypothetical protein MMC25_005196 [Agyrium rufum]|nr:hypothetical protein [Agyrium rufum]